MACEEASLCQQEGEFFLFNPATSRNYTFLLELKAMVRQFMTWKYPESYILKKKRYTHTHTQYPTV